MGAGAGVGCDRTVPAGSVEWSALLLQLVRFWQRGLSALCRSLPPGCHHRLCLQDLPMVTQYGDGEWVLASGEEPVAGAEVVMAQAWTL